MGIEVQLSKFSQLFVVRREIERIGLRHGEVADVVSPNVELWKPTHGHEGFALFCASFFNVQGFDGAADGLGIPSVATLHSPDFPYRLAQYYTLKMRVVMNGSVQLHVNKIIPQSDLIEYPEEIARYNSNMIGLRG